jgi:hypothetical protein
MSDVFDRCSVKCYQFCGGFTRWDFQSTAALSASGADLRDVHIERVGMIDAFTT